MLKIFKYLTLREWAMAFISVVFIISQVWLELAVPGYMIEITKLVQTPGSAMTDIWSAGGMMLLATLGSLATTIIVGYYTAMLGARFARRLRSLLFGKVDSFSMEEIDSFSTDSLITRSTNDITQVQMLITMGLMMLVRAPIMAVLAISRIAGRGFEWTVATGIAVAVTIVINAFLVLFVFPKFQKMQDLIDNLNRVTRENLTGLRVVRAYNAEAYQETKFEQANAELTDTQLFTSRAMSMMMPMMGLIMSGVSLAIYWIGAYLINEAAMLDRLPIFANMVVFSNFATQAIMAFMMLTMVFVMLPRAAVSARRINEVLERKPSVVPGSRADGENGKRGELSFNNVSFKYPGASDYILRDITFDVMQGETVAFIGSTGSGKTTLVNLVPRFFDATEGEIRINGMDIRGYTLESLYSKIGYVPQKSVLFKGNTTTNVAFGDNSGSAENVKKALEIAQCANLADAEISQGGTNVSGGQRQRLSIARAVARKPEIYIFDDSFSALDYKTDKTLRKELKKETENVTSLIVAQRIGTVMDADQIIVLDEGKIVGRGRHKELLETCDLYKQIALSQLSGEELAS